MEKMRLLVVDDHTIVRDGIRACFLSQKWLRFGRSPDQL